MLALMTDKSRVRHASLGVGGKEQSLEQRIIHAGLQSIDGPDADNARVLFKLLGIFPEDTMYVNL